ncbi:MAG TPA: DUF885 domain-containing protein [Acidimicrobiia bacterium]|nr:DUF885 domain-containing protein [Acidimicrobiia bacterium]
MHEGLRNLGDEYREAWLRRSPTTALMLGDHRYDDQMEDLSREAEDDAIAELRSFADRAEAIDPADLSLQERLSREVLIFEARTGAAVTETRQAELEANPAMSLHVLLPTAAAQFPIIEPEHAEALVVKCEKLGRAIEQWAVRLQEGVANDRTPPALMAEKVVHQLDEYLASPLESDPLATGVRAPAAFDEATEEAWRGRLRERVGSHVRPGFAELRRVLAEEVLPVARPDHEVGIQWIEGGEEAYRAAILNNTSVDMTAEEIHQIGLDTIASIEDEYRLLGSEVFGSRDLQTIYSKLNEDPNLRYETADEVVAASEEAFAKAKAAIGGWFGRLPKADCLVSTVTQGPEAFYFPPAEDGSRPGIFFMNVAEPSSWTRYALEATVFHEGIPGHHLQLAIAQELEDIPEFRKHTSVTAYAEGWGLYTERLSDEMGLYSGPLQRMGMLSADSLRASRLVVDTGMHALGWSRQQAIDYMTANVPASGVSLTNEVDRYIGLPGQALAYMIGRREIMRIRSKAKAALGGSFDIKSFHDTILGSGALPLPVLAHLVDEWVAGRA